MKISTQLTKNQLKIIYILFYTQRISFDMFKIIWDFDILDILQDIKHGISKLIRLIVEINNRNHDAYSKGYDAGQSKLDSIFHCCHRPLGGKYNLNFTHNLLIYS